MYFLNNFQVTKLKLYNINNANTCLKLDIFMKLNMLNMFIYTNYVNI